MNFLRRQAALALACAALWLCAASPATAQGDYPGKPIKLVVGFAPGGPTDVLARILAQGMTKPLGQQVIVDNRAGAGGAIGTLAAAKAPADGYTLLFSGDGGLTVLPQIAPVQYDPVQDFQPIRVIAGQVNVLVAHASTGITDVASLLDQAKAKPGVLSFGSAGNGTPSHLVGAVLQSAAGIELLHVPYKGAGPAMTDLLGGQTNLMFVGMPVALQNASRKELKLLAVTGDKRSPALPDVPTFAEAGIKGLGAETGVWWAVMAPKGVPAPIQKRIDAAIGTALADPEVRKAFSEQGVDVLNLDAGTVSQWMTRDHARWAALIKAGKVSK